MGARPAEIGEHAIAQELGDVPLESRDLGRDRIPVALHQLTHHLGVEAGRKLGRPDQVDEHDRELAPVRLVAQYLRQGTGGGDVSWLRRARPQGGNCPHELLPMSERQPQSLEFHFRQIRKNFEVDIILLEQRRVVPKPDPAEPLAHLVHAVLFPSFPRHTSTVLSPRHRVEGFDQEPALSID
jgi:hypothetical protein